MFLVKAKKTNNIGDKLRDSIGFSFALGWKVNIKEKHTDLEPREAPLQFMYIIEELNDWGKRQSENEILDKWFKHTFEKSHTYTFEVQRDEKQTIFEHKNVHNWHCRKSNQSINQNSQCKCFFHYMAHNRGMNNSIYLLNFSSFFLFYDFQQVKLHADWLFIG